MTTTRKTTRLIIGISGASGVAYGIEALKLLADSDVETHLVMSKAAERTLHYETDMSVANVKTLADVCYNPKDIGAAIASGSFKTAGMLVAPCSIKTMGEINTGITSNLLSRAADVVLKDRRRLVLMVRETPLHLGHLRTMTSLTEIGAVIAPPVPAFYAKPKDLAEMVQQTVARSLDMFDIECEATKRWGEDLGE